MKREIPEVFEALIKNRILSVPVLDNDGKPVFIFSMMHLVNHFVHEFSESELQHLNSKKTSDFFLHYSQLKEKKAGVLSERASQILDTEMKELKHLDPVHLVKEGADILEAVRIFVTARAHRVVVVNPNQQLVGLITQSRILQFVETVLNLIKESDCSLKELNFGFKDVCSINEHQMAISAFKLMREKKISAVAVVNDNGELVGNISANDLKLVGYDLAYFSYLSRPIREYIQWVNDVELEQTPQTSIRSQVLLHQPKSNKDLVTIACVKEDTFSFVIKALNFYRIHRMYIVDKDKRPIGVISIHDVLEKIFKSRM